MAQNLQNKSRKWFMVSGWSKQTCTHTRAQWSHASVGLTQARPNSGLDSTNN